MPPEDPSNDKPSPVKVRSANLDLPTLVDRIGSEMLDHLIDCQTCRATFTAQDRSLGDAGCLEGRRIVSQSRVKWQERRSALARCHITEEILDDYIFDRLTCEEREPLEHHARSCVSCARLISQREALVRCIKAVFRERKDTARHPPVAVVDVRFPARAVGACSSTNLDKNR